MSGFIESYRRQISTGTLRPLAWWEKVASALLNAVKVLWSRLTGRRGRILAKADEIMKCFADSEVPVLGFLAKEYAVLVNWHAAVPGETWPNRQFAHAATSHGTANITIDFYEDETIFERLEQAGQTWEIYVDGVAQVWAYPKLWLGGEDHFHDMDRLMRDIATGTLPAYAFIEPNHGFGPGEGNSQHPGNNTVSGDSFVAGEALMARIYNALVANPELFAETLFLITYDEHGGFFDHVTPKRVTPPDGIDDRATGFDFSLTGVRVPAVAVSPLIPAGTVDPTFYDHSAIPATVRQQFAPDTEPLTRRDAASEDLLDHLPLLPAPRTDLRPVRPPATGAGTPEAVTERRMNDFQGSLVELAGAVRNAQQQIAADRTVDWSLERAEAMRTPAFVPDPDTHQAAQERVLRPGSRADQVVQTVVDDFTREGPRPDPGDAELGN
jgi:phospholipase C